MANPVIRTRILDMLRSADFTVAALAEILAVPYNSAAKAIARAMEEGQVHVCGYAARAAALYRLGEGVDVACPAPDPVAAADEEYDAVNARDANVRGVELPMYFELDGGLLPGVRHFACDRLRATMSVSSCGARWEKANSTDVDADRFHTCRRCSIGAAHAGRVDHNPSQLKGMTICGRCHRGATRLIGKHLCVSCFNRARELRLGKNGKGTAPVRLAKLDRRSISYRAGSVVKTRIFEESGDTIELVVAVLRDENHAPQFTYRAPASMDWLLDEDVYDRSIGDALEVADVAAIADVVQDAQEHGAVASVREDVVAPLPATLDVELVDPEVDIEADPYGALRDAVDQLEHDTPACAPSISKRAAKRQRRRAQRVVRVSNVTVEMLRCVGALPPAPALVVPVPVAQPSYSAVVYAGGVASG